MRVRKAVITAAGWGTRFLPATKSQPKEMLPLVDKPMIQYIVEEAVASGIELIVVVTSLWKGTLEDHFDRSRELESFLEEKGNLELREEVGRISQLADICYIRQKEQLGLGHAILAAKLMVGEEPFAVFLPDDIIVGAVPAMKQMLEVHGRYGGSLLAIRRVEREQIGRFGIIDPERVAEGVYRVRNLVEKPDPERAPSNLGVVGRYVLSPSIFPALEKTLPGKGGEIQLTDGLATLLATEEVFGYEFQGTWLDAGTPLSLLKASVSLALGRPDMEEEMRHFLKELLR
ncbi:MAG: UTP--glucose-1-phosphate uridylyltransferase GalU [Chloroflexi bacterium]|nr:UTP--glucose-1-phosphate uridylyltransferase GalU [Chloroflexota bacterium]